MSRVSSPSRSVAQARSSQALAVPNVSAITPNRNGRFPTRTPPVLLPAASQTRSTTWKTQVVAKWLQYHRRGLAARTGPALFTVCGFHQWSEQHQEVFRKDDLAGLFDLLDRPPAILPKRGRLDAKE